MDLDNLIDRGYRIVSSANKQNPEDVVDLFYMLSDKEHEILGSLVVMHDFSVHFEVAVDGKPEPCTSEEFKEILKNTHSIDVQITNRDIFEEAISNLGISDIIKRIKEI